jgi:hypothetical protein
MPSSPNGVSGGIVLALMRRMDKENAAEITYCFGEYYGHIEKIPSEPFQVTGSDRHPFP